MEKIYVKIWIIGYGGYGPFNNPIFILSMPNSSKKRTGPGDSSTKFALTSFQYLDISG